MTEESKQCWPVYCPKCQWRGLSSICRQEVFYGKAYCPDCWSRNDIVPVEAEKNSIKSVWDMVASLTPTEPLPDFKYSPEAMQRINEAITKFQEWQNRGGIEMFNNPDPQDAMPREQSEELKQIIYALERSAKDNEEFADKLMAAHDYSAEFPASDAAQIRKAIELLNRLPPGFIPAP